MRRKIQRKNKFKKSIKETIEVRINTERPKTKFRSALKRYSNLLITIISTTAAVVAIMTSYYEFYIKPINEKKAELEQKVVQIASRVTFAHNTNGVLKFYDLTKEKTKNSIQIFNSNPGEMKNVGWDLFIYRDFFTPHGLKPLTDFLEINSDDFLTSFNKLPNLKDNDSTSCDLLSPFYHFIKISGRDGTLMFPGVNFLITDIASHINASGRKPPYSLPKKINNSTISMLQLYPAESSISAGINYKLVVTYEYENYSFKEVFAGRYTYCLKEEPNATYTVLPAVIDGITELPWIFYKETGRTKYNCVYCYKNVSEDLKESDSIGNGISVYKMGGQAHSENIERYELFSLPIWSTKFNKFSIEY